MRKVRKAKRFLDASKALVVAENYMQNYGRDKGHKCGISSESNEFRYYFYVDVFNSKGNKIKTLTNYL